MLVKSRIYKAGLGLLAQLICVQLACAQQYFRVSLENIDREYAFWSSDLTFNTTDPNRSGIQPGDTTWTILAVPPDGRLSFALQFGESNDLFYAPDEHGIALRNERGRLIHGDVTDQVYLWDAGTEANEEPGLGPNQLPRQAGPDTGPADPDSTVRRVIDGHVYPEVNEVLRVELVPAVGHTVLLVRIYNVSNQQTLVLSDGTSKPVSLSLGPLVVHTEPAPIFTPGVPEPGDGLEALAEDGSAVELMEVVSMDTGPPMTFAPGVWAAHTADRPLFAAGEPDRGAGLEELAEDGNPVVLAASLARASVVTGGTFAEPVGSDEPGLLRPGQKYEFTVAAKAGARLSLASMLHESNDLFVAPGEGGIPLWADGQPVDGDLTDSLKIWDAGTEVSAAPGYSHNQAARQARPGAGEEEGGVVRPCRGGWCGPGAAADYLRLTVRPLASEPFTVRIENVSGGTDPVILGPGVALVHAGSAPIYSPGSSDRGMGLEALAEDAMPGQLASALSAKVGFEPVVFSTPEGTFGEGPILPGYAYRFVVHGAPGTYVSFATMFVASNDLFYAPSAHGVPLFGEYGAPLMGDLTRKVMLWDAGTEANEEPGMGPNQPLAQSGPNMGPADPDSTVRLVNDGYQYPDVAAAIRVTMQPSLTAADPAEDLPSTYRLGQNYPNPFNPSTTIAFELPVGERVSLSVYNLLGQHVVDLASGHFAAGTHALVWNGTNAAGQAVGTGLYIYRLVAGGHATARSMLLIR